MTKKEFIISKLFLLCNIISLKTNTFIPAMLQRHYPVPDEPIRRSDRSRTLVWLDDSIERLVFCLCLLLVGRVHLQIPFIPSLFLIWQSLMTGSMTSHAVRAWFVNTSSGGPGLVLCCVSIRTSRREVVVSEEDRGLSGSA
jgi:hypothetical protein